MHEQEQQEVDSKRDSDCERNDAAETGTHSLESRVCVVREHHDGSRECHGARVIMPLRGGEADRSEDCWRACMAASLSSRWRLMADTMSAFRSCSSSCRCLYLTGPQSALRVCVRKEEMQVGVVVMRGLVTVRVTVCVRARNTSSLPATPR